MARIEMTARKHPDLKLLHGNPGNGPVAAVPSSTAEASKPPADFKGEALAEWKRVTAHLLRHGQIEAVEHGALAVYCSAWAMFDAARRELEDYGPLVSGRDGGLVKNPAHQMMMDGAKVMATYGAKFGLTPKDRQNMGLSTASEDAAEDLDRALKAL